MRKAISALTSLVVWAAAAPMALADSAWEFSVQISAAVSTAPAQIVLSWPQDTFSTPQSYTIYRKSPNSTTWGSGETLPGTTTTYADRNVSPGVAYEYQVVKKTQHYTGYGYICAGLNLPLVESRGKVVLVIDKTQAGPLGVELARLQQDLVGDGWTVERLEVNRTDTPVTVKNRIRVVYAQDPANVKAVFLFGHIPCRTQGTLCRMGMCRITGAHGQPMVTTGTWMGCGRTPRLTRQARARRGTGMCLATGSLINPPSPRRSS